MRWWWPRQVNSIRPKASAVLAPTAHPLLQNRASYPLRLAAVSSRFLVISADRRFRLRNYWIPFLVSLGGTSSIKPISRESTISICNTRLTWANTSRLTWRSSHGMPPASRSQILMDHRCSPLFQEQLGLKLESPEKAPVEMIVIDRIAAALRELKDSPCDWGCPFLIC